MTGRRRRRRNLADVWAANVAAAGDLQGDLSEQLREHLVVQDEYAEVEELNQAIVDAQLFDQTKSAEELSGL